jgi:phenylacetic acid degradation protein
MIAWKTKGTELYQSLPKEMFAHSKLCEQLKEIPANLPQQDSFYSSWKQPGK